MVIPKALTDAVVSAAKGVAKKAFGEILTSVKGENQGKVVAYRAEGNNNIVCFVHGFCGKPDETFNPIPDFISQENELEGWDILSIGYASDLVPNIGKGIWAAKPDLKKVSKYLETHLEILGKHYGRIMLIGHSMGGLVVQRTLVDMKDISAVSHVLFFGTPSAGLRKAWFGRWFNIQVSDMDYKGEFILNLRKDWDDKFKVAYPFYFETVAGELDEFVPVKSSLEPFAEKHRSYTSGNHVTMVKPKTISDTSFLIIKNALKGNADSVYLNKYNYQNLNNLIGSYHLTIHVLEQRIEELDDNGLKQYIFALEGTGKLEDAIAVIKKSKSLMKNSDLMGILGGRYKRKYLIESTKKSLAESREWYEKGMEISKEQKNPEQIHYHAINLAFINLMEDEQNMVPVRKFAQLAIDNCNKVKVKGLWELATIAEANIYLGDLEKAKTHYAEALKICDYSLRETSSMLINAIYACNRKGLKGWRTELEKLFAESKS